MAIDMKPDVGRIVLNRARSTAFFQWYEPGGVITRVAGKRVYYKDASGNEKFTHEYGAVVDTKEEEARLLDWSYAAIDRVQKLHDSLSSECEALWAAPAPAATPRRERKRKAE